MPQHRYYRYANWPIRMKLMVWIIPMLVVTIGLTGTFSYYIASQQVLSKSRLNQINMTRKLMDDFNYIAQDAVDFSNFLFLSDAVQDLLDKPSDAAARRRAFISLSTLMVTRRTIQSLIIYPLNDYADAGGEPFAIDQSGTTSAIPFERFKETTLYAEAMQGGGKEAWSFVHALEGPFIGDRDNKLVLVKVIKNANDLSRKAIIVVGIDENRLKARLTDAFDASTHIFLVDRSGTIMSGSLPQWIGRHYWDVPIADIHAPLMDLPENIRSDERLISHTYSAITGWHAFVAQPKRLILKELDRISIITVLFMSVCLLAGIFVSWFATVSITRPLGKLLQSMRRLQQGDFTQRVQFAAGDEIGQLGRGYNSMVRRIDELINDVYSTRLKQREAELKTLQEQINPHFLYNTLDMIYWSARKQSDKDLSEMIYSLSKLFRLRLNNGQPMITLEQELELVRHYLQLQRYRFKDRLDYDISAPQLPVHALIPKLIIQPLVENAVAHGLEPMGGEGCVQVLCEADETSLRIQVIDNGRGISPERLGQITAPGRASADDAGFALRNIEERLKLAYGEGAALEIASREGSGTTITLRIPLMEVEQPRAESIDRRG